MFWNNIKISEFNKNKNLVSYVDFKSEFLSEIWSDKYRNHMISNFGLLKNQYLLVALKNKEVVGQLFISFKKNKEAYIEEIEVSSSVRKKGIGKKLIDTFKNKFEGFDLTLMVEVSNENAINFYLNLGFEKVEVNNDFLFMKLEK